MPGRKGPLASLGHETKGELCREQIGFFVQSPSDTKTGAISPKQAPLEHALGGRTSRPPRLPAAGPPPVREAAVTARPVAPVIPGSGRGHLRQGKAGADVARRETRLMLG